MSKLALLCFYHTSFLPLWLSVLFIDVKNVLDRDPHLTTEKISIVLILVSSAFAFGALFRILGQKGKEGASQQILVSAKEEKSTASDYLLSYVLPLSAFNFTQWDQTLLFLMFYFVLGYLCVCHNYVSANISLEIMDYRLYKCQLENVDDRKSERIVLSRRRLGRCVGETLYLRSLNNECKLDLG